MSIEANKTQRALSLALEALEEYCEHGAIFMPFTAVKALEEALANHIPDATKMVSGVKDSLTTQQEQGEPVGEMQLSAIYEGMVVPVVPVELPAGTKLYTTPQSVSVGEPVAKYIGEDWNGSLVSLYEDLPLNTLLYTTPPPQQRKPLTDEQIDDVIWRSHKVESNYAGWVTDQRRIWARAIEAAHGIKE